jgi:hypothetical protein
MIGTFGTADPILESIPMRLVCVLDRTLNVCRNTKSTQLFDN